jgi:tetratricopeptide (TPR) repeat protein
LVTAAVLGAYGQSVASVISIVLVLFIEIWLYIKGVVDSQAAESINRSIAKILFEGGLGNLYSRSIYDEVENTGRAKDISERLNKALEVDPNDQTALAGMAVTCALAISERRARGLSVETTDFDYVEELCQRGMRLYPNEDTFRNALGVLADAKGEHAAARSLFARASLLSTSSDPHWRLYVATSYGLSGDHEQALCEIEQAISEGASVWFTDFYMGRTLCSLGRYGAAVPYLKRARRHRRFRWEIAEWLRTAHFCQAQMAKAIGYQLIVLMLLTIGNPRTGLKGLPGILLFAFAVGFSRSCRFIYILLSAIMPKRANILAFLKPDSLELSVSEHLLKVGHFDACEQVCRAGLAAIPDSYKLAVNLAGCLAMQGRRDEAITEIDKVLVRLPDNKVLLWNRKQIASGVKLNMRFPEESALDSLNVAKDDDV